MGALDQCMYCMAGSFVNGICSYCGREKPRQANRDMEALSVGSTLRDQYLLGEVLGRGGFGITYAAWDKKHNRRVALKELFPAKAVDRGSDHRTVQPKMGQETYFSEVFRRFEQEAGTLMTLQQMEGVVSLYHVFSDNGTAYYAMEYLDGMNLRDFIARNGPMSWEELAPNLRVLLRALQNLHSRGVIHRDISPDNIFLTRDGQVRLIDFGAARAFQQADHFTVYLKKCFAPWEQYLSEGRQGPWTDIYSLSVTAYYILSGKLPPTATDRNLGREVVPLMSLCPRLPAYVAAAIEKGMAPEVEDRFKDMGQLMADLYPGERPGAPEGPAVRERTISCRSGCFRGKSWPLNPGTVLRVGRRPDCDICYPPNTNGVSRVQFTIAMDDSGRILVRDESSYGTMLLSQERTVRLPSQQWTEAGNCWLWFGSQEQFYIQ